MASRAGTTAMARKLGARIRALRLEANLTQERLAWECDLDKGYLSQVESGKRLPSVPVLSALASRLELEVADLVGYDLDEPRLYLLDAARRRDVPSLEEALRRLAARPPPPPGGPGGGGVLVAAEPTAPRAGRAGPRRSVG